MASDAVNYITETWDSLINGKSDKKKKNEALDEIDEFLDGYAQSKVPEKPTLPSVPEYERMVYEPESDESIRASAENSLAEYKSGSEKSIENEINALGEKYRKDIAAAESSHAAARDNAAKIYDEAAKNTDADMLKRGIARSSIAANKRAAIEDKRAAALAGLYAEYTNRINELNDGISALDVKRVRALDDFNLAYAAKLSEKISELKAERDRRQTEVLKYNNSLAEKEYAAQADKKIKESALYDAELDRASKERELASADSSDYEAIYGEIQAKLRGLNKNDARDIVLNNPRVRASVGSFYYYKLYDEFCR